MRMSIDFPLKLLLVVASFAIVAVSIGSPRAQAGGRCDWFRGVVEVPLLFGEVDSSGPPGQKKPPLGTVVKGSYEPFGKGDVTLRSSDIETKEFDYEIVGAVVCETRRGLYGIKDVKGNIVWISQAQLGRFHPYEEMAKGLVQLSTSWDGRLWDSPGIGAPKAYGPGGGSVRVEQHKVVNGKLWFRVRFTPTDHCSDTKQRRQGTGWIPAHREGGVPILEILARGC